MDITHCGCDELHCHYPDCDYGRGEPTEVEDLGESTVVVGGRRYQLGTQPGSADVHIREGYMVLRCEAEHVMENEDGAITFGFNDDDIARLLEVLARSGNLPALAVCANCNRNMKDDTAMFCADCWNEVTQRTREEDRGKANHLIPVTTVGW